MKSLPPFSSHSAASARSHNQEFPPRYEHYRYYPYLTRRTPDARERGFDRDDYSAEDDLCKGVRRMSTTPQKVPERAPFRHYSYRDADERPPAWQRKSAF